MGLDQTEKKLKILIVDDIPANISVLRSLLRDQYEIFVASSGYEALEKMEQTGPDLILLDVMMPDIDGFETCRRIKSRDENYYLPVILVTALDGVDDRIKGIEAGADDFITKPVNQHEVLARVKSLLRIKLLHDQLQDKINQLEEAQETLKELAITDGLTGLYNYRFFKETLKKEIERAKRSNTRFSLLLFDIDDFKVYNDTFGHLAGDQVLKGISCIVMQNIRSNDVAARYGGEEFALVLPDTDKKAAHTVADKIKTLIDENMFDQSDNAVPDKITISVGVATFPDSGELMDDLIESADRRLYIAKDRGKNQVIDEG